MDERKEVTELTRGEEEGQHEAVRSSFPTEFHLHFSQTKLGS